MTPSSTPSDEQADELKKYWFYCSEWHNADCDSIRFNEGVCNCDTTANEINLKSSLAHHTKEAVLQARIDELQMAIGMKGKMLVHGEILASNLFTDDADDKVDTAIMEKRLSVLRAELASMQSKGGGVR